MVSTIVVIVLKVRITRVDFVIKGGLHGNSELIICEGHDQLVDVAVDRSLAMVVIMPSVIKVIALEMRIRRIDFVVPSSLHSVLELFC